ncbi:hypothetical protein [Sphingomonas adhaesiva]|uniref:hypothetical protein n=1 Tax=Sphingomonas adhaesiva TaxID=28212 RepID=UPI002FFCB1D8
MLDDDAPLWRFAPDTLLKALVAACEEHGDRLEAEIDALIQRGDRKAVRQPWGTSTTASALKDAQPAIYRLRNELASELPATLGKLLRLAQLEQQRQYVERSEKKGRSPAEELATDLPARIKGALTRERKAAMPAPALFHAAFMRARDEGLVEHDDAPALPMAEETDSVPGALTTGFVLPPADFEKSGRPIPRPYWDAVRAFPFHCPLDLPVGDGTEFEWEDDSMPRYASYEEMIARDPKFAFWAKEARQRFTNLSMHVRMMRDTPRDADEKIWQWADRAYARIVAQTGADMPDPDLSRLIDHDYDILLDDERCRIWWHWAERRWAITGYLSQQCAYHTEGDPSEDDVVAAWLFLLVGRHVTDEWLQPDWLRERLFDWRALPLFAAPVPAVRYLVPRATLIEPTTEPDR